MISIPIYVFALVTATRVLLASCEATGHESAKHNEKRFHNLLRWLGQNHATLPDADREDGQLFQIGHIDSTYGIGLLATQDISGDTTLFRLPQQVLLTSSYMYSSVFQGESKEVLEALEKLSKRDISCFYALNLLVLDLFNSDNNNDDTTSSASKPAHTKFLPYLQSLPIHATEDQKVLSNAFLFNTNEMLLLDGSSLVESISQRKQSIQFHFNQTILNVVKKLKIKNAMASHVTVKLTHELFLNYVALSWSRVHKIFNQETQSSRLCFVPLGDLINYSSKHANVVSYTDPVSGDLVYKADRPIKKGAQLFVEYNTTSNFSSLPLTHRLLLDYGVCDVDMSTREFTKNTFALIDFEPVVLEYFQIGSTILYNRKVILLSLLQLHEYQPLQSLYYLSTTVTTHAAVYNTFDLNILAILRVVAATEKEIDGLFEIVHRDGNVPLDTPLSKIRERVFVNSYRLKTIQSHIAQLLLEPLSDSSEEVVLSMVKDGLSKQLDRLHYSHHQLLLFKHEQELSQNDKERKDDHYEAFPLAKYPHVNAPCLLMHLNAEIAILQNYQKILGQEQQDNTAFSSSNEEL